MPYWLAVVARDVLAVNVLHVAAVSVGERLHARAEEQVRLDLLLLNPNALEIILAYSFLDSS